jgi:dimethylargininase
MIHLPPDPFHPDSVFIEDTALILPGVAILARPGAESRRGEVEGVREVLREFIGEPEEIRSPGTLEAGDVLEAGDRYYIGVSGRTNQEGASQLVRILEQHGKTATLISLKNFLHLKTGVSFIGGNHLLVAGELKTCPAFQGYKRIEVEDDESYAANSILVNDRLIMPQGYPKTHQKILKEGLKVIQVDVSEFRKLDGGLSCLSLRL